MEKSRKLSGTSPSAHKAQPYPHADAPTDKAKARPKIRTLSSSKRTSNPPHIDLHSDSDRLSASIALCSRHQITQEVLLDTQPAFEALRKTEDLLIATHESLKPVIKADENLSSHLKVYKKRARDPKGKSPEKDEYRDAVESLSALANKKHRLTIKAADFLDENSNFSDKIYPLTGGIRDTKTGLYAQLMPSAASSSEYFLCFPGTGAMNNLDKQWATNIANFMVDGVPKAYRQAVDLAHELRRVIQAKGGTLKLAGHSLGGGIANYVGLKLGLESVCFNPSPMGKGCLMDLGNDLSPEQVNHQTHLIIEGDLVADSKGMKLLHQLRGHSTPLVGKVYDIPEDHSEYPELNAIDRHQMDAFIDLYLFAKTRKARELVAEKRLKQKQSASDKAPDATSVTNTTTTTTTTTVGPQGHPRHVRMTRPDTVGEDASEETVRERRRQAAREEKKPEKLPTPSATESSEESSEHSEDRSTGESS